MINPWWKQKITKREKHHMKDYRENNRPNTYTIISDTGHKTPHNPYDKTLLINIQCQKNQNYSYTQHIQWVKMKR